MRQQMSLSATSKAYVNKDAILNIDITPYADQPTWARLCVKTSEISDDMEETTETYEYICGDEESVEDVRYRYGVTGHSYYDDAAQRFIINAKGAKGNGRRTNAQLIFPWGTIVEGPCTILDIVTLGGGPKERMEFGCTLAFDGENPNGTGTTTLLPDEQVALGSLPTPTYDTSDNAVEFNFGAVANPALPLEKLIRNKVEVFYTTSAQPDNPVPVEYQVSMGDPVLTLKLVNVINAAKLIVITNGIVTRSLQTYEQASYILNV